MPEAWRLHKTDGQLIDPEGDLPLGIKDSFGLSGPSVKAEAQVPLSTSLWPCPNITFMRPRCDHFLQAMSSFGRRLLVLPFRAVPTSPLQTSAVTLKKTRTGRDLVRCMQESREHFAIEWQAGKREGSHGSIHSHYTTMHAGVCKYARLSPVFIMAVGQKCVPKMEPWQMETQTKTCGLLVV